MDDRFEDDYFTLSISKVKEKWNFLGTERNSLLEHNVYGLGQKVNVYLNDL